MRPPPLQFVKRTQQQQPHLSVRKKHAKNLRSHLKMLIFLEQVFIFLSYVDSFMILSILSCIGSGLLAAGMITFSMVEIEAKTFPLCCCLKRGVKILRKQYEISLYSSKENVLSTHSGGGGDQN